MMAKKLKRMASKGYLKASWLKKKKTMRIVSKKKCPKAPQIHLNSYKNIQKTKIFIIRRLQKLLFKKKKLFKILLIKMISNKSQQIVKFKLKINLFLKLKNSK